MIFSHPVHCGRGGSHPKPAAYGIQSTKYSCRRCYAANTTTTRRFSLPFEWPGAWMGGKRWASGHRRRRRRRAGTSYGDPLGAAPHRWPPGTGTRVRAENSTRVKTISKHQVEARLQDFRRRRDGSRPRQVGQQCTSSGNEAEDPRARHQARRQSFQAWVRSCS